MDTRRIYRGAACGVMMASLLTALACSDSSGQDAGSGDGPAADSAGGGVDGPAPDPDGPTPDTSCDPGFGQAQACGGDLEGKWTYVKGCVPKETFDSIAQLCKGAKVSNESSSAAGALNFTKSTYTMDASMIISTDFTLPTVCSTILKGCPQAASAIQLLVKSSKVSCSAASAGCDCKITLTYSTKWLGQYSTANGVTTLKTGQQYHYCVKGNVLRYRGAPANLTDKTVTYVLTR